MLNKDNREALFYLNETEKGFLTKLNVLYPNLRALRTILADVNRFTVSE
jgi:hypothetical protein